MNLWVDSIRERDLDVLLMGLFSSDPSSLSLFLGEDTSGAKLISMSLDTRKNSSAEAVTVIFEKNNRKTVLLIADLIMDVLKEGQKERFKECGRRYLTEGRADKYCCCVISPKNYIEKNSEMLRNLQYVSYETIAEFVKENPFLNYMFVRAIEERKRTYSEKVNRKIVDFWRQYYDHVKKVFPDLRMKRFSEKSGFQTMAAIFTTKIPGVSIYHKTDEGVVDVMGKIGRFSYTEFSNSLTPFLLDGMKLQQSRGSVVLYMKVPVINFRENFDEQIPALDQALEAVVQMQEFLKELDYGRLEQIVLGDSSVEDYSE